MSILAAGIALFLIVDRSLGLEAAPLFVVLPCYFLYKVVVEKDVLFTFTAIMLVVASLLAFLPPVNLGPRNIVAYVAFFEVARHVIKRVDETVHEYFALRLKSETWGLKPWALGALDWFFGLFLRSEPEEKRHANETATQPA